MFVLVIETEKIEFEKDICSCLPDFFGPRAIFFSGSYCAPEFSGLHAIGRLFLGAQGLDSCGKFRKARRSPKIAQVAINFILRSASSRSVTKLLLFRLQHRSVALLLPQTASFSLVQRRSTASTKINFSVDYVNLKRNQPPPVVLSYCTMFI